ncbi:hypothetical protein EV578_108301 [Streptomyces sp. BK205]|nr:hypothetical protein EV578_108301 [Streptomyces sp. BK205]
MSHCAGGRSRREVRGQTSHRPACAGGWRRRGAGWRAVQVDQLLRRITLLDQDLADIRGKLVERAEELAVARAVNRGTDSRTEPRPLTPSARLRPRPRWPRTAHGRRGRQRQRPPRQIRASSARLWVPRHPTGAGLAPGHTPGRVPSHRGRSSRHGTTHAATFRAGEYGTQVLPTRTSSLTSLDAASRFQAGVQAEELKLICRWAPPRAPNGPPRSDVLDLRALAAKFRSVVAVRGQYDQVRSPSASSSTTARAAE